jgi:t-SNARE complex subunit (syntaxin)
MREATPPLPNTPSQRGAQLKHRDNFTIIIIIIIVVVVVVVVVF